MAFAGRIYYMKNMETKIIRPDLLQFVIDKLHLFVLLAGGVLYCGLEDMVLSDFVKAFCILLGIYLCYGCIYLLSSKFIITDEQLIYERGVFTRNSDYIELYRVVDFKEYRSFLQQIVGLKTVVVYSGDRTHPKLVIPGVQNREELVKLIRNRMDYNKKRKGIYEITNR